ncbi:hypothetical protein SALBM311S_07181 [Streptomyces alboniger]
MERPDGSEVLIPFVEEIVTEIDLEEQRAVIDPAARPDRRPRRDRVLRDSLGDEP